MNKVVLCAVLALSGCETVGTSSHAYEAPMKAYIACNQRNAVRLSSKKEDALLLASAAESACSREKVAMGDALAAQFGPVTASGMVDRYTQSSIRNNLSIIVERR